MRAAETWTVLPYDGPENRAQRAALANPGRGRARALRRPRGAIPMCLRLAR